ncbi:hypothetical protein FN846DRAFT_352862 [Sphaerosporella brunnea]|uniref:Uncharacterized protein n=1 Tax=Sphaerosporella brunnea TaxID=1250544 RepID=A0A5J5EHF2_9PEZI|nr:hypothetical protein FN846DRAFT_352862 [Sphaerosporella brunnea]
MVLGMRNRMPPCQQWMPAMFHPSQGKKIEKNRMRKRVNREPQNLLQPFSESGPYSPSFSFSCTAAAAAGCTFPHVATRSPINPRRPATPFSSWMQREIQPVVGRNLRPLRDLARNYPRKCDPPQARQHLGRAHSTEVPRCAAPVLTMPFWGNLQVRLSDSFPKKGNPQNVVRTPAGQYTFYRLYCLRPCPGPRSRLCNCSEARCQGWGGLVYQLACSSLFRFLPARSQSMARRELACRFEVSGGDAVKIRQLRVE